VQLTGLLLINANELHNVPLCECHLSTVWVYLCYCQTSALFVFVWAEENKLFLSGRFCLYVNKRALREGQ